MDQKIISELSKSLDPARVKEKAGRPYLEGHDVISALNRIFGYGAWGYEVLRIDGRETVGDRTIYTAHVRLDVRDSLPVTDVGVCITSNDKVESHETAIKGAVTDGLKRSARHFGDQFGNSLYETDNGRPGKQPAGTRGTKGKKPAQNNNKKRDPFTSLWEYCYKRGIDREKVDETLEKVKADPEKALILLKEEFGE